jgi:hypothetical protein
VKCAICRAAKSTSMSAQGHAQGGSRKERKQSRHLSRRLLGNHEGRLAMPGGTSEGFLEREAYRKHQAVVVLMERGYGDLHANAESFMECLGNWKLA